MNIYNRLRLPTFRLDLLVRRLCRRLVADIECFRIEANISSHETREKDIASLGVEWGIDRDPLERSLSGEQDRLRNPTDLLLHGHRYLVSTRSLLGGKRLSTPPFSPDAIATAVTARV